jgi:2-methylisocitrate lyase-like PEP mutase family enzyme
MTPGGRLRQLLAAPGALLVPGVWDALSARIVEDAGFSAAYVSGAAISASVLAEPDLGFLTFARLAEAVRSISQGATEIPLIIDADTGYSRELPLRYMVDSLEQLGVAAIQIEDQTDPKRCGHLDGVTTIDADDMAAKINEICAARRNRDTVIIARTDARAEYDLDEAIRRGNLYAEAGADMIFVEAPQGWPEVERVACEVNAPLLLNLGGRGATPERPLPEIAALGYKIVIYPGQIQRAAIKAMQEILRGLRTNGSTIGLADKMVSFDERNALLGLIEQ